MAKGTKKIAPALRRVHLDFHTPDFIEGVGSKLDADKFAQVLADGQVQQAAFFAKCHYGNAYYPTKVGRPHPGLACDMLGRFVEAGRKRGVRTFAYYSLQFDFWYGKQHPDVVQHTEPFCERRWGPWIATCVNNEYGKYAMDQVAEVVKLYDVAGVWLDIVGYYPHCVCPHCRESFQKDTGKPLPFDESNPQAGIGSEYMLWQRTMLDRYTDAMAEMMGRIRPGCELLSNTASGIAEKPSGQTNQRDGQWCEESVGNNPASLTTISMYGSLFDSHPEHKPFEICSQRTHMGWGDWTLRPLDALNFDTASIIAHGGLPSIGDQLYGDGSFDPIVYERVGQAYKWLAPRQEFCGQTSGAAEIGIFAEPQGHRADPGAIYYRADNCLAGEGLFKMMLDAHCPSAMLSSLQQLSTGRYRVVLTDPNLPDCDASAEAMAKFVRSGGSVLAIGIGPQKYWPLLGITQAKPLSNEVAYIRMPNPTVRDLDMPVLARIQGQEATLKDGCEVLAYWTLPVCPKTKNQFFSHQHAPPGEQTSLPAIWRVRQGKGSVLCIAAPLAKDYWYTSYPPLRHIIEQCLDTLLPAGRQVYVEDAPVTTEVTLRRSGKSLLVNMVVPSVSRPGVRPGGVTFFTDQATAVRGVKLCLRLPKGAKCRSASQLGKGLVTKTGTCKGYVSVALAPFTTHTAVRFDLAGK